MTINSQSVSTLDPESTTRLKKLLIVDDHPVFRHGIIQLLRQLPEITICGEAEDGQAALEGMRRLNPDVVLLDVSMPGANGIEVIKLMLAEQPNS